MEQRSEIRFGLLETGIGNNLLSLSEQTNVSPTNFTEMRKQFPEAHKVSGVGGGGYSLEHGRVAQN